MDKIVDYLSSYATTLTFDTLPPQVVWQTKRMMIDSLGCAIGGFHSEPSRIARELASTVSSSRPATILGSGQKTTPDLAAFANGVMIRYLDFNDAYTTNRDGGHPSDTICAILAPGEVAHTDGKAILTATVLAYEVFCRLCDAVSVRSRGYDQGTFGVIASGLGAAKVMGLSREQLIQTINLCVVANVNLIQTRHGSLSMWKGCAVPNASRNAVFAALLAEGGLTGPSSIFEGPGGFFEVVCGGPFTLEPFGGNGRSFKIMEPYLKRFPVAGHILTVIQAALEVRDKLPSVENIEEVNVQTSKFAVDATAGDDFRWHPLNRETADHSSPYAVAVALMYGAVEQRHFNDEHRGNPTLQDLVQKVKVSVSEEANRQYPKALLSTVEVVTSSGERFSSEVPYPRGHRENPMTDQELEEKFRSQARDLLTPEQTNTLLDRLWTLEEVDDIGQVIEMVRL